jgi:hypothetical protein
MLIRLLRISPMSKSPKECNGHAVTVVTVPPPQDGAAASRPLTTERGVELGAAAAVTTITDCSSAWPLWQQVDYARPANVLYLTLSGKLGFFGSFDIFRRRDHSAAA